MRKRKGRLFLKMARFCQKNKYSRHLPANADTGVSTMAAAAAIFETLGKWSSFPSDKFSGSKDDLMEVT